MISSILELLNVVGGNTMLLQVRNGLERLAHGFQLIDEYRERK